LSGNSITNSALDIGGISDYLVKKISVLDSSEVVCFLETSTSGKIAVIVFDYSLSTFSNLGQPV
jgi:hypothetical protein